MKPTSCDQCACGAFEVLSLACLYESVVDLNSLATIIYIALEWTNTRHDKDHRFERCSVGMGVQRRSMRLYYWKWIFLCSRLSVRTNVPSYLLVSFLLNAVAMCHACISVMSRTVVT